MSSSDCKNPQEELVPLEGKYYKTVIQFGDIQIELVGGNGRASDREVARSEFTLEQYLRDDVIETDMGQCAVSEIIEDPGGHYEKQDTYQAAIKIVNSLNSGDYDGI